MAGLDRKTGKALNDEKHLRQSIIDILTTPIGSRVLRRDYGSRLFELIDSPLNHSGIMDIYKACVTALALWEPRLSITNIRVTPGVGTLSLDITGLYKPNGQTIKLSGVEITPT